jgi:hypothetical protein
MIDNITSALVLGFGSGALVVGGAWLFIEAERTRKKMVHDIEQYRFRKILRDYHIDPAYYGEITLTWKSGDLVAITLQDDESRILKVLWEKDDD